MREDDRSALSNGPVPKVLRAEDLAAEVLRKAILQGRLSPQRHLREEALAAELGLSRTPVRAALKRLEAEGLVESAPNKGTFVRSFSAINISEMYEIRAVLEGLACRRAAERITEAHLSRLRASCDRFEELAAGAQGDVPALLDENLNFHRVIADAAGQERLQTMISGLFDVPLQYVSLYWRSRRHKAASEVEHRAITKALEDRDADAAESGMRSHVLAARAFLIEALEG
jgi:DNA-binding GntR family transcriptional regulator